MYLLKNSSQAYARPARLSIKKLVGSEKVAARAEDFAGAIKSIVLAQWIWKQLLKNVLEARCKNYKEDYNNSFL
jgi:hypothetical protein